MNRYDRVAQAEETVEIVRRGGYTAPGGHAIDLRPDLQKCLANTRFYRPDELEHLRQQVLAEPAAGPATVIEVVNDTTLAGIARLVADGDRVAALNFASAKHPGGGFLSGAQAQEESLARSSALVESQLRAMDFYEMHRKLPSLLYSDAVILSPDCPIFRDDAGQLLERPHQVAFLTCAAPNAGATADNRPHELSAIPETIRRRSECVLAVAAANGYRRLVLGAWGCGVFRNEPRRVAEAFAEHLHGAWAGRFERVVFSVLDRWSGETFAAFQKTFG